MFNATRVAAVVAALALAGSLAYVALPEQQAAVVPGAPVTASDFAGFTGTFRATGCTDGEISSHDWGHTVEGDLCSRMTVDVSDERMNGAARAAHNAVRFKNGPKYGVRTLDAEIVNDGGRWAGTGIAFHDPDDRILRYELLLTGEDGYEGLSAMLSLTSDPYFLAHEAEGVVFPGELPPYPVFDDGDPAIAPAVRSEIDPAAFGGYEGKASLSTGGSLSGTSTLGDFGFEARGDHYWDIAVDTTDSRMGGMQESLINANDFMFGGGRVHTTTDRIVAEDGWWEQSSWGYVNPESGTSRYVNQLIGHGGNEGLSAVSFATQDRRIAPIELDGVIFPGELPPYPVLPPAE